MNPKRLHSLRQFAGLLPALLLFAVTACSDSSTDPSTEFNGPTGFSLVAVSGPTDVTPDGSTVLLEDRTTMSGNLYFYELATGVLTQKTNVGTFQSFATGLSSNLRISANYSEPTVAAMWSQANGWATATPVSYFPTNCDIFVGGAWDISADGHTWVGFDWNACSAQAMLWSDASGSIVTTPLELLGGNFPDNPNPPNNRASAISDDGLVIGGFAQTPVTDRRPVLWSADGLGSFLTSGLTDDCPGEVLALNENGSMAAGVWCLQGFYWTAAGGTVILEGMTVVNAIAANGNLLFGGGETGAAVWTATGSAAGTTRSLQDVAVAAGIEIPSGVILSSAVAASTDGTVVIGQAVSATFEVYSYVLKLPASAYGL